MSSEFFGLKIIGYILTVNTSSEFFGLATIGYILAMMIYIVYLVFKNQGIGVAATVVTVMSFLCQTAAFLLRWRESYAMGIGHVPMTNLYESLVFFVWCLMLGYLIIEYKYKNRMFGAFVTPIAGMALGFISLTAMSQEIQPLMPALKSNWLLAHVTMSFLAYSAFALSFATALMYLILTTEKKRDGVYIFWTIAGSIFFIILCAMGLDFLRFKVFENNPDQLLKGILFKTSFFNPSLQVSTLSWLIAFSIIFLVWRYGYRLKAAISSFNINADMLDELTYKIIAVGFPIFTIGGLIFGAVWADQAWGVYWSWDPKETWSLITWLCYAGYLHARFLKGWRGRRVAVIAVIGFITVIFTYLGVNIFLSGLHSYGDMG